ncbi:MAG TPA: M15 family metallopeptidase [Polyangiaceae bacterium]|nr:M15 family metallopeptidase [Polyangiaceae bacterium]
MDRSRTLIVAPLLVAAACLAGGALSACASSDPAVGEHAHEDEPTTGSVTSALVDADPVSKAVTDSCTTASVRGLGVQLVGQIQCLRPNTMARIDAVPNTTLGGAVFPYLQSPAADALRKVAASRGVPLVINSALRTLPQQYLLYRWYRTGRCGIGLAASPGTSNHESGVAVDVNDNAAWRTPFQNNGWRWLGSSDPVHYDYTAGGVNIRGLSVKAFQVLWNRNNPTDRIDEDGVYGPATETRLARSPIGGFAMGPSCPDAGAPPPKVDGGAPGTDAGVEPPLPPNEPPEVPDGQEPDSIPEEGAAPGPGQASGGPAALQPIDNGQGCSAARPAASPLAGLSLLGLALGALVARRRRQG